jgi:hypothetical protein
VDDTEVVPLMRLGSAIVPNMNDSGSMQRIAVAEVKT